MRRMKVFQKSDERVLGDGDFVEKYSLLVIKEGRQDINCGAQGIRSCRKFEIRGNSGDTIQNS